VLAPGSRCLDRKRDEIDASCDVIIIIIVIIYDAIGLQFIFVLYLWCDDCCVFRRDGTPLIN